MFKATILKKSIENGVLQVRVSFSDENGRKFEDAFSTNQAQPDDWLEQQIRNKLKHMNALPGLHDAIEEGKMIDLDGDGVPDILQMEPEKEEYKRNLQKFTRFVDVLAKGFATKDHEEFIALKKWLTDNFKTDYLDLF